MIRLPALKTRYDLFVFDLDGTLLDSRADIAAAANATLVAFGVTPLTEASVVNLVGAGVHQLIDDLFATATGESPTSDTHDAAYHFFMRTYGENCTTHTVFYPGVTACLEKIGDKKLAVLTNKPESFSLDILAALACGTTFYPVIGGDHPAGKKPAPEGLRLIMATHGIAPERTLMLGDSPIDVATAKAAGCESLVFLSGFGREIDLRNAAPTWILQDFHDLVACL